MGDLKIVTSILNDCKIGVNQVDKIYLGNELLWSKIVYGSKVMTFSPKNNTTGVSKLTINIPYNQTVNIQNGFLYDDINGNSGQTTSKSLITGINILYFKCTTISYLYFYYVDKIIDFTTTYNSPKCDSISFISDLIYIYLWGNNSITGSITNLSNNITTFSIAGDSNIISLPTLPNTLQDLCLYGSKETISTIPTLPVNLLNLTVMGRNTIHTIPTLPPTLIKLEIWGYNTINVLPTLPSTLIALDIQGYNTINDMPTLSSNIEHVYIGGNNSIGYNIANIPNNIKVIQLSSNVGNYTYNQTTGKSWSNSYIYNITIRPKINVWTSNMTDSLLIDLVSSKRINGSTTIDISGNCGARTSASDTAINTLRSRGAIIITN